MTLPTGVISVRDINIELNVSPTQTVSLGSTNVRNIAQISSGPISMGSLRGKSVLRFDTPTGSYSDASNDGYTTFTITSTIPVPWVYTVAGNPDWDTSSASGVSATSLTVRTNARAGTTVNNTFTVSVTYQGTTYNWSIYLIATNDDRPDV